MGLLFRKGDALQRLAGIRTVAFDKTGTLTIGCPELKATHAAPGFDGQQATLLARAAAAEAQSEHPLARAMIAAATQQPVKHDSERLRATAVVIAPGLGLDATVSAHRISIGTARHLAAAGIDTAPLQGLADHAATTGQTPVWMAQDGALAALFLFADTARPGAAETVKALKTQGIGAAIISGDTPATARSLAAELGIGDVTADVRPEGKVRALHALAEHGGPIAFVGDGINDAPALAAADVGIAIGTGTDVAVETADVVLMSGDPAGVPAAIALSRATLANIRQNLIWAFGYNVALVPVAAGALYPATGMMLSPMLAAAAMAASSVLVVMNALRLARFRYQLPDGP